MIKIISLPSALEVEEAVNKWLDKNYNIKIISLHYSTVNDFDSVRYSVLIYYST